MGGYAAVMVVVAVTVTASAWISAGMFTAAIIPAVLPASRARPPRHSAVILVRREPPSRGCGDGLPPRPREG
jgi:hypothetical protein